MCVVPQNCVLTIGGFLKLFGDPNKHAHPVVNVLPHSIRTKSPRAGPQTLHFNLTRHPTAREKAKGRFSNDADESRIADFCIATVQDAMLLGRSNAFCRSVTHTVAAQLI